MLKKTMTGMGVLLLGAAAVSLAALSAALLLGVIALVIVAAAGLYLASPEEAKLLLRKLPEYIDGWIQDMRSMVREAGVTLMTVMGKKPADGASADGRAEEGASTEASAKAKAE